MPKPWPLILSFATNVYLLGAMIFFAAIAYPQFGSVDRASFPPLYRAFTGAIPFTVVLWEFVAFLATLLLYLWRPEQVPSLAVHLIVALGVGYFAITFGWHLPSHRSLAAGDNSAAALAPLLASQWARTAVQAVRTGLLGWALARALSAG